MNLAEMDKKVLKKIRTGYGDSAKGVAYDAVSIPQGIKHDYVDGGSVLVVHNVPITKVGVQQYGDGFHLKTKDAVSGIRSDFSPISIYHPNQPDLFSEMSDEEAQALMVGWQSDGYFDEKTNTRIVTFYFKVDKLKESPAGRKMIADIEGGKPTDVSIGFRVDIVDEAGEYEGQKFDKQQVAIDHDHTAVLPGARGRYSFSQGIGIGAEPGKKQNGGASMDEQEKKSNPAADAIAATMSQKDKSLADAQAALDASRKAEADAKAELDVLKKAEAARAASTKTAKVDAIMKRVTPDGKEADAEFRKTLEALDDAGLSVMDKKFGENIRVVDNTIHVVAAGGKSNDKVGEINRKAQDAFVARYCDANKIPEAQRKHAVTYC